MVEHLSSLPKALGLILQNHPKNSMKGGREKKREREESGGTP